MKIPYAWIREFVDLRLTAAQAADRLVNAGIEVASVTPLAPDCKGVVVGEIEAIERELGESHGHRLVLCRVSTGRERYAVVCGAPNTRVGARAAFAPPGAVLAGGRRIASAKIHGAESQGMLCSERELGIGEEHEAGILLLDGARPGADLIVALGLDDHVLEVEITPNRPDCLSVVGIARELAALTGARFRLPTIARKESGEAARTLARVRIEAPDLCHRFTARVIDGVTVGPSPGWLRARLRAVGLRPISNVVDATNYVLWELGQPLHAYDYETVADGTIVVRRARAGERFTTLDGQERALDASMLLIADPRRAIGLAGVMGGANTEVTDRTTRVLLESAWFAPASIRRTSRALGLRTDAAYRFERGADVEGLVAASARAAALIAELAGGTIARGAISLVTHPAALRQGQTVRRALVGAGLAEVVTYAFTDPARAELLRRSVDPKPVELMNPLAQDASLLRVNPLEGVLSAVATNVRRQQADVRVFEVGKVYQWGNGDTGTSEPRWVAIALTGGRGEAGWSATAEPVDVYDAKGLAEHVLAALAVRAGTGGAGALSGFEPDCHGTLVAESGAILAEFGEVAAALRESFGIAAPVFAAVVSLDAIVATSVAPLRYQPLPRFPAVERDLAFVIGAEQTLTAAQIEAALGEEAGPLLRRLVLFDVFRFPDGRSSLAWRLLFQAEDRTLTDAEVNAIQERVVRRISETFHVTLRSG